MLKRAPVDVLKSRYATIQQITPVGYFGLIIRNSILKTTNFLMKVHDFVINFV